jgi:hypothetical protein
VLLSEKSICADSKVDILKINPQYFDFELVCAEPKKKLSQTANIWAKENNLLAVVNAGMFNLEGNFQTCTGYMKNYKYLNNSKLNKAYNNVIAFNRKDTTVNKFKIIDLTCDDFKTLKTKYNTFVQGIRMLDCKGVNTWSKQSKMWSMVLMGEDKNNNVLFIFVRSPYKVHDFVNHLLNLDIGLKKLIYLEGGPEASLYVNHEKLQLTKYGSYETDFNENDENDRFWEIPNVIGIKRRK